MSIRRLTQALHENWKKNPDGGYQGMFFGSHAVLKKGKKGKVWYLHYKGKIHQMPKKASFDHAEGIIVNEK